VGKWCIITMKTGKKTQKYENLKGRNMYITVKCCTYIDYDVEGPNVIRCVVQNRKYKDSSIVKGSDDGRLHIKFLYRPFF
jgi:hypothetical protein